MPSLLHDPLLLEQHHFHIFSHILRIDVQGLQETAPSAVAVLVLWSQISIILCVLEFHTHIIMARIARICRERDRRLDRESFSHREHLRKVEDSLFPMRIGLSGRCTEHQRSPFFMCMRTQQRKSNQPVLKNVPQPSKTTSNQEAKAWRVPARFAVNSKDFVNECSSSTVTVAKLRSTTT